MADAYVTLVAVQPQVAVQSVVGKKQIAQPQSSGTQSEPLIPTAVARRVVRSKKG